MMTVLLLVAGAAADFETPFEPAGRSFADAASCKAFLAASAGEARGRGFDSVEGPYAIAAGDVRIHTVRAEGRGHRIDEQRCLGAALSARSWRHSLDEADQGEDESFTAEAVARSALWLKKAPAQQ